MKERHFIIGLGILCALPLLYGTSYLITLESAQLVPGFGGFFVDREPKYRFGGKYARAFFAPAKIVDQRIRPSYWVFDEKRIGDPTENSIARFTELGEWEYDGERVGDKERELKRAAK